MKKLPLRLPAALPAALLAACLLAACAAVPEASAPASVPPQGSTPPVSSAAPPAAGTFEPAAPCYFAAMAARAAGNLPLAGDEDDVAVIRAAYRYIIERTTYMEFDQPELYNHWRHFDECGRAPSVYEIMAAGPLEYGIGTCEDYAAALVVLLGQLGYEAQYVPGLTYSWDGYLVDHAWTMVKMGGVWYHIDAQLEDNVIKGADIQYRYFLKGDEDFRAHHVWGRALPNPDPHSLTLPDCPRSAPQLPADALAQAPCPQVETLVEIALQHQQAAGRTPVDFTPRDELPPLPGEWAAIQP